MRLFIKLFFLLFGLFFLSGCDKKSSETYEVTYAKQSSIQKKIYTFGVHPLHNPKKLFEVYQPLVDFLNLHFVNAKIKLEASRNYDAYDKKLFKGYFDLALPNPYQTIIAAQKGYTIFGKMADDENFRGIIITRKDANIQKVQDLFGKVISYPAPTALAATMMPQYFLYQNGLDINTEVTNSYVGSQESSIMNVYLNKSSAGSTWPPPWIAFKKEHPSIAAQLEVKWETKPLLNNGLVAKNNFPKELLEKISEIIFNLHTHEKGRQILEPMELSHFEKADYHTYDSVRNFLEIFEKDIRVIRNQN